MPRIDAALATARARLADSSDTPALDARLLLCDALGCNTAHLIAHGRDPLDARAAERFERALARRATGEPVAYIIGRAGFWDFELDVDAAVLVPRPDTETLVETALALLPAAAALRVADLGTGSGAIALALARERPHWRIVATDASDAALACAARNIDRLAPANVELRSGRWLEPLAGERFDAIVSNPPYVAAGDPHLDALGHEPRSALVAADEGLADIALIARDAGSYLAAGGLLALEHGADQGTAVRALLTAAGFTDVATRCDLGTRERVTFGYA